jgi:hypothetical protein
LTSGHGLDAPPADSEIPHTDERIREKRSAIVSGRAELAREDSEKTMSRRADT